MIYLIISILCSVTVGVLFKIYKRYDININQVITWNYISAIILSWYFFNPEIDFKVTQPFSLFITLGLMLPVLFWFLNKSLKSQGLARTDIAQRLSLVIPLTAAWFLFNENISVFKWVGLVTGVAGVLLVFYKKQTLNKESGYFYPIVVFFGYGIVDVLFKKVARINAIPYTTALFQIFILACFMSIIYLTVQFIRKKDKFQLHAVIPGLFLGLFNFGNILSYLRAHKHFSENPSTVFAAMNLGVIVLGSAIGIMVFKEKFGKINYIGIALTIMAVIWIALSQKYAI